MILVDTSVWMLGWPVLDRPPGHGVANLGVMDNSPAVRDNTGNGHVASCRPDH